MPSQLSQSTTDFLRDVDKLKSIESMDRAALAAAFERQAKRLIDEEVRPKIAQALKEIFPHFGQNPPPPANDHGDGGSGDGLPGRVQRLETKMDKMADDMSDIKTILARIDERLAHMPRRAEMYLSAGLVATAVLGVMAKGFHWL